jgi:hypothetical protein
MHLAEFSSGGFMKPKTLFSVFLLFFILIPFSFGEGNKQAGAISHKGPSVFFPSIKYEFTPVAEGNVVGHHFIVQNKGDETLHINKIKTG